jgi:hypothetical protein
MTPLLGVEMILATIVPLYVGSVAVIHELRRSKPDLDESLRIATTIWFGICLVVAAVAIVVAEVGFRA